MQTLVTSRSNEGRQTALVPRTLVVEDNPRQLEALVSELGACGIQALVARSGAEALRVAAQERPELILIDGLLPNMHGFEVARFIRHLDSEYRPFLVITTAIYKGVRYENEARLKYGIDMYLAKPVTADKVQSILASFEETITCAAR